MGSSKEERNLRTLGKMASNAKISVLRFTILVKHDQQELVSLGNELASNWLNF